MLTWTSGTPTVAATAYPRGVVHRFDNTGDTDAKALDVTPGIGPDYFREENPRRGWQRAARPRAIAAARWQLL